MEKDAQGEAREIGFGWRRLLGSAAIVILAGFVLFVILSGEFDPFMGVFIAPVIVGLILLRRPGRVGVVVLGIASLVLLALFGSFVIPTVLPFPEALDFIPGTFVVLGALSGVLATIPAFRQGKGRDSKSSVARALAVVVAVLLVAGSAYSAFSFAGVRNDTADTGDIAITIEEFEFSTDEIDAESGLVTVIVTNNDRHMHTFSIDEFGVNLVLPGGKTRKITFQPTAGEYRFYCKPHSAEMEGTLKVA